MEKVVDMDFDANNAVDMMLSVYNSIKRKS